MKTTQNTKNFQKRAVENQDRWIENLYLGCNSFDEFRKDVKAGDIITIPVNCIVPRSSNEWEFAKAGNSQTDSLIKMTFNYYSYCFSAELVIFDGHNRLKQFINDGIEIIKVEIVN